MMCSHCCTVIYYTLCVLELELVLRQTPRSRRRVAYRATAIEYRTHTIVDTTTVVRRAHSTLHKHVFLEVFHYTLDIMHIPESLPKTPPYDVSTSSHPHASWTEESRYRHSFFPFFSHFSQQAISGRMKNEE